MKTSFSHHTRSNASEPHAFTQTQMAATPVMSSRQLIQPSSFLPALAPNDNTNIRTTRNPIYYRYGYKMNTAKKTFIIFILLVICTYSFFWRFMWSCSYRNCPEQNAQRVLDNLNEAAQNYWAKLSLQQSDLLSGVSSSDFGIGQDDKQERERQFLRDVIISDGDDDDVDVDADVDDQAMRVDDRRGDKVPMKNVSKVLLLTMGR